MSERERDKENDVIDLYYSSHMVHLSFSQLTTINNVDFNC